MRQTSPRPFNQEEQDRHGLMYISRDKQPSMFEILSWKESYNAADDKKWLERMKNGNKDGRFTEQVVY